MRRLIANLCQLSRAYKPGAGAPTEFATKGITNEDIGNQGTGHKSMKVVMALIVGLVFVCGAAADASAKGRRGASNHSNCNHYVSNHHLRSDFDLRTNEGVTRLFEHIRGTS